MDCQGLYIICLTILKSYEGPYTINAKGGEGGATEKRSFPFFSFVSFPLFSILNRMRIYITIKYKNLKISQRKLTLTILRGFFRLE
jgi:hypothetical protein